MGQIRTSRWRRALVAACLPYLVLSVFINFVHLHPLLDDNAPQISATNHVAPCPTGKVFDSSCALCQWLRAGTGLQPLVAAGPSFVRLPDGVKPPSSGPARRSFDRPTSPRGPPAPRVA